ncbi:uncharacterized protein FMAN_02303 [Fusarium mangiferae]|uniref:C2H2-type domain-containing protein n=1 Tax=Fusarium mangiferae TaxID=192010 RepID=A0A1L7TTK9_FUSMA|nr:uncharacterized protein FMAN_02303 [Fusarium mangiferae]CVK99463.1 uncharacterized protein FMAN_02303 [Fusarium mangiferae]
MAYYCTDRDKLFYAGRKAHDQHCQVAGHASPAFECDSCSDCFEDEYDRRQHMNLEQQWHRNVPECQLCGDRAVTQAEIREHEIERHFHCAACNRQFMNANNLRMASSRVSGEIPLLQSHLQHSNRSIPSYRTRLMSSRSHGPQQALPLHQKPRSSQSHHEQRASMVRREDVHRQPNCRVEPLVQSVRVLSMPQADMTLISLKKHFESPRHQQSWYHCVKRSCGKEFKTLAALINHLERQHSRDQHCEATGHFPPCWECNGCGTCFGGRDELRLHEGYSCSYYHGSHYANYHQQFSGSHIPTQQSYPMRQRAQHYYSVPGVACPFCSARYSSASGVVYHLEQGACPNVPLNRGTQRQDPNGASYNRLLVWRQIVYYQATAGVYNTYYGHYECYFCGALFRQLSSLNQHLASPRHQQEFYYWPIGTPSWSNYQHFGTGYYQ